MADYSTIARPYAKAAFALAQEQNDLAGWSASLEDLAEVVSAPAVAERLDSPAIEKSQWAEAIIAVAKDLPSSVQNFVRVMADGRRLAAMAEVASQFDALRAEAEQTLDVEVQSATAMADDQQAELAAALKARFNREIKISVTQDPSLIGGAIIRAGDQVIDGSVRTKLEQLASNLAH